MRARHLDARGVVRAWLLLGIGALALATAIALVLAASRAPVLGERLPVAGWFRTALVLHVVLAVGVWSLSVAAAHWSALAPSTRAVWLPLGVAAAGVFAMLAAPYIEPGEPVLNNYLPVLNSSTFLGGLVVFGAGVLSAYLMALGHAGAAPAGERGTHDAVPALLSGVPLLMAIV